MNNRSALARCFLFLLVLTPVAFGQQDPNQARGFDPGKPFQMNGLDNINLFNGNLTITIPIGQTYHVSGSLSYGFTLIYSGNSWDTISNRTSPPQNQQYTTIVPNRRSNAGMGWLLSLGRLIPPWDPTNELTANDGSNQEWIYEGPDGHDHVLYPTLHPGETPDGIHAYTRDSTYIRMTTNGTNQKVEFPDGNYQIYQELDPATSPWPPVTTAGFGTWKLTELHDQFGNSVAITYKSDGTYPEKWEIADGTRTQRVFFKAASAPYTVVLDHVELTSFGTTGPATWTFGTTPTSVDRGPGDTSVPPLHVSSGGPFTVPLLTSVQLPAINGLSQHYSTVLAGDNGYDLVRCTSTITTNCSESPGHIRRLTTPTGGRIEWDYAYATLSGSGGIRNSDRAWAVKARTLRDGSANFIGQWTYNRKRSTQNSCSGSATNASQLVSSVTDPDGTTSVHYFSVFRDGDQPCPGDVGVETQYGLELSPGVQENGLFLASEVRTGNVTDLTTGPTNYRVTGGTLLRSDWTTFESESGVEKDLNFRESAHRTKYDDDNGCGTPQAPVTCFTATNHYLFDTFGHYRQTSTDGNLPGAGNYRTTFTNHNPAPTQSLWILTPFTEQCAVDESGIRGAMATQTCASLGTGTTLSGPVIKQYCFESSGFLSRQRALYGTTAGDHDLLAVFSQQNGNVTQEDYYGGDSQTLDTGDVCSVTPPNPSGYQILHTYSNGSLATTYHRPKSGDPIILEAHNDIDSNTGLVQVSYDTSGISTNYSYDVLGRIQTVTPTGEVEGIFDYSTPGSPVKVTAHRASASGTIQTISEYDALGRLSKETETLPTTTTSRITTYTGSGRINTVSQWQNSPVEKTTYSYDPFGRPLVMSAPDGSLTTTQYSGVRSATRTVKIGTSRSGSVVSPSDTVTTETYDAQGRLITLHDAAGNDTNYSYDVSGHLTNVVMGAQTRAFEYDGRGFLANEQHPELNGAAGVVRYSGFDSRGHTGVKLLGDTLSGFDVAYTYDALERLAQIDQITARSSPPAKRILKTFTFGTTGASKGKLLQDLRHNYRGTDDVVVTEDYTYRTVDGKLTDRQTTIDKANTRLQQFKQSYDYSDIGALSFLKYPICTDGSRPCGSSTLTSVSPVFTNGMVTSISGFANSISYHDDGTINQIAHPGTITDTYEADDHAMGRPKSITFANYDTCSRPSVASVVASPSGTVAPQTMVQLTATPAAGSGTVTYQWYHVVNEVAIPINGATSAVFSEAVTATSVYRVRVANGCGASDSAADITISVCSSLTITTHPASVTLPSPNSGTILSVVASGCGTLSYQWYQVVNSVSTPVGTNSSSYSTGALTATATFWVKVTDSQGAVDSNNAVVTVACSLAISTQPQGGTISSGESFNLHVTATGCGTLSYQWYQVVNSVNTPVGTNSSSYSTGALTATSTFWVKVTDSQGTANSNHAVVTIACSLAITTQPQGATISFGESYNLHVTASGCTSLVYHWYIGQPGDTSNLQSGGSNSTLTVSPSTTTTYWVQPTDANFNTVNSIAARVTVRPPVPTSVNAFVQQPGIIRVTWQGSTFAFGYLVQRCSSGGCNSLQATSPFDDAQRIANTTYVYRVASIDTSGNGVSAYSTADLATTMTFTPVQTNIVINRTHINELLTALNLVRAASGAAPVTWSQILPAGTPPPPAGAQPAMLVYKEHITSLRTQMDAALSALGIPASPYSEPLTSSTTRIKAIHFTELQGRTQ
jgi:YD repeat-containing protein